MGPVKYPSLARVCLRPLVLASALLITLTSLVDLFSVIVVRVWVGCGSSAATTPGKNAEDEGQEKNNLQ